MKRLGPAMLRIVPILLLVVLAIVTVIGSGGGNGDIAPFWTASGVVVEDFDGDGRADIALAMSYVDASPPHSGYVHVYRQTASGAFAAPDTYAIGPDPWGLSSGDVNNDGRLDLVAATPASVALAPGATNDSGQISILRQDATNAGSFLPFQSIATGGAATDAAFGLLTADSLPDVVVADGVLLNGRALLLAQNPASPGSFLSPVSLQIGAGHGSEDVAVGDVNGDGLSDVVLAAGDVVAVFYRNAAGGFDPVQTLMAGKHVSGVALADLDRDTSIDIAVANAGNAPDGGTGESSVTIMRQVTAGSFTALNIPVADGARRLAIADLNDDTLPDIAVVSIVYQSQVPSKVSVLVNLNTTPGEFFVSSVYDGTFNANFIAVGDIDNDSLNDIVINEGPTVFFQQPTAVGTFAAGQSLP
ncbi:MAG: VCBS repeat-containing protein [Burkholderiales bacterium]|jgi:hypothetical protein